MNILTLKRIKVVNKLDITAKITGINYEVINADELQEIQFSVFDVNSAPSYCKIKTENSIYGVSKWVSPKRTRSYPFERVYNTLNVAKKITVIPVIKDEGSNGDRDFIQWDTISLMSLLDVYVILAYYNNADKHSSRINKITDQKFDNDYVKLKITEISNYHSSALHWNMKETSEELSGLIDRIINSYNELSKSLNVKFHKLSGIEKFKKQFNEGVEEFKKTSRDKARDAQNREMQTQQPKEYLSTLTKAKITISNFLGGMYYFTTDEVIIKNKILFLIEGKHTKNTLLPSVSDIKDGLLKMVLYSNLKEVRVNSTIYLVRPKLKLTSKNITGVITSENTDVEMNSFIKQNKISDAQATYLNNLFSEAIRNNFIVEILGV